MVLSSDSKQLSDRLMSSVLHSHTKIERPVSSFILKSTSEFASRSADVFGSLKTIENKHQTWISNNETHESFDNQHSESREPVQCPKDVFKRPSLPLKRKISVPRRPRHVKKWIKYSLVDIPLSSDATNSAVAFQFLKELRKKKEMSEIHETTSTDGKLLFRKPKRENRYLKSATINNTLSSSASIEEVSNLNPECFGKLPIHVEKDKPNVKLRHLQDDCHDV